MDHQTAIENNLTERYLLNELGDADREQFEEHYFSCAECAADIRAGAAFIEGSRTLLRDNAPVAVAAPVDRRKGWLAWLWTPAPAWALAGVLGATLALQQYRSEAGLQPQVVPGVELRPVTRGEIQTIHVAEATEVIHVSVTVPEGMAFTCVLSEGAGRIGEPITTPVLRTSQLNLLLPAKEFRQGPFRLTVDGRAESGAEFHEEFEFKTQVTAKPQ